MLRSKKRGFSFCFLLKYQNLGEAEVEKARFKQQKRLFKNVKILLLGEASSKLSVLLIKMGVYVVMAIFLY